MLEMIKSYPKYIASAVLYSLLLILFFAQLLPGGLCLIVFIPAWIQTHIIIHFLGDFFYHIKQDQKQTLYQSIDSIMFIILLCAISLIPALVVLISCFQTLALTVSIPITFGMPIFFAALNLIIPEKYYNRYNKDAYILRANILLQQVFTPLPIIGTSTTQLLHQHQEIIENNYQGVQTLPPGV